MKIKKKLTFRVICLFVLFLFILQPAFLSTAVFAEEPLIINGNQYILYVPRGIDVYQRDKKYPLVVAFSPSADAQSMIDTWKNISEKYKWLILASKEFRNGLSYPVLPNVVHILKQISKDYPIDTSKIIASGFSGGGMCSYFFAFEYPELISAVVSNCGVIHKAIIDKEGYNYIEGKLAVFLVSPSDFNYNYMKNDQSFLEGLNWKTYWIEFQGGHAIAPDSSYQQAAEWLNEQFLR